MEGIKKILIIFFKLIKWLAILIILLVIILGIIEFAADVFFEDAAKKDGCADSGGAWDYKKNSCRYTEPP